jgi:hypothetical protein
MNMITTREVNEADTQEELKALAVEAANDFGHHIREEDAIRGLAYLAASTMNLHMMHIVIEITTKWNRTWPDQTINGHMVGVI